MWEMVNALRASGVTIILTTHYIEEAEQMADRIGVINKGEIILIENKRELMQKLGQKQLALELHDKIDAVPPALAAHRLELSADKKSLIYTYEAQEEGGGIASLLSDFNQTGIRLKDIHTTQKSLEDIFVSLVRQPQ
jgi:ABC-2 type transport system ATP-binding protein